MTGDQSQHQIEEPLADGQTNLSRGSTVEGYVAPQPLVFYRPETDDLLIVPMDKATAFENECRALDQVMHEFHAAKEANIAAMEALLEAERAANAPQRTVPQSPQRLRDAEAAAQEAEQMLVEAQEKVETEFKPLGTLDGTSGKLYELIPIRNRSEPLPAQTGAARGPSTRSATDQHHHAWSRKWTYVRSDKVKNHFRSYKLNEDEQGEFQSNQKKSFLTEDGKIDTERLAEQVGKLEVSVKWRREAGVSGVLLSDLNGAIRESLTGWAEGINSGNQHLELGVEAQLLRYFAGAGIQTSWNPRKGNMAVRGDARAEFAIAEGRFNAAAYWPSRGGHMIRMTGPRTGTVYEAGLIRAGLELQAFGLAGASASAQLALEVDYSGTSGGSTGARGKPSRRPISRTGLDLARDVRDGGEIGAGADLFAGARAGGSVNGMLEWNSPEAQRFEALCKIGPGGQVQAGAGIAAQFRIDYVGGKFRVLASAAVCLGLGAGGKLEFEVDPVRIYEFTKYLAYLLYSVGYEFMEIIAATAFEAWANFSLWAIQKGVEVADAVAEFRLRVDDALDELLVILEREAERVALMNRVLSNPAALEYAPPETKGMILYQLTRHGRITKTIPQNYDWNSPDTLGRRKRAVLVVCRKARSRAEFRNICQHMTANGAKDPGGWEENYAHLQRFLDYGIDTRDMDQQLRDFKSDLASVYRRLYEEPILGYAFVDNNEPTYIARAARGDHDGYMVAGGYDPGSTVPAFGESDGTRYA